jgi:hypothetical protein
MLAPLIAAAAVAGTCPATPLEQGPSSVGPMPWVMAQPRRARLTGHVFYHLAPEDAAGVLTIYAGGLAPGGVTKILWVAKRHGSILRLRGVRLDAAGTFVQSFRKVRGPYFPSVPDVPAAGCWRFALRTGKTRASVVAQVLAAPG